MTSPAVDDVVNTFAGLHPGERLCVGTSGVWLFEGGAIKWRVQRRDIVAVQAVRTVGATHVEDRVQVLQHNGGDAVFAVGRSSLEDDYEVEYTEALADAIAEAVRSVISL